jgi:hypothetical protein
MLERVDCRERNISRANEEAVYLKAFLVVSG